MVPTRVGVVLVAVLAASAGCSGLFGAGDAPETATVTPVEVPEVTPSPAPGVPAPSARAGAGELDVRVLLAADRRVRANSAYRFERNVTVDGANVSMRIDRVRRVGPDGRVAETLTVDGSGEPTPVLDRADLWANGTGVWSRTRLVDGRVLASRRISDTGSPFGWGLDLPETVLTATEVTVRGRGSGGAVLSSARPFSLSRSLVPLSTVGPRYASARLLVSERGLIRWVHVDYRTRVSGAPVTVSIRQRVTGLNRTTVTRPGWVEAARRNASFYE